MHVRGIPSLWADLKNAGARFLAVDYDGTLAPFRIERMEAFPAEDAKAALKCILSYAGNQSCRDLRASGQRSGNPSRASGCYDHREPRLGREKTGKNTHTHSLTPFQAYGLQRGNREAEARCNQGRIERKTASVAVHTRGMDPGSEGKLLTEIKKAWSGIEAENEIEIRLFNGGVELRAMGWDKGRTLESLMIENSLDTYFVYIGDDQTDEDAFRAVRRRGVGIRVGPVGVPSLATGYLKDCDEVVAFLNAWTEILGGVRTGGLRCRSS